MRTTHTNQDGITLLITLLIMGVLLAVSASILTITLKQYLLSGAVLSSEMAFQAASAGMECALYADYVNGDFATSSLRDSVQCFGGISSVDGGVDDGDGLVDSGEEQRFEFSWGDPEVCTDFSVYKYFDDVSPTTMRIDSDGDGSNDECPPGSMCTLIESRGYNVPCSERGGTRVVEREYTQVY